MGTELSFSNATRYWEKDGIAYAILKMSFGHYCGYCAFPQKPVKEESYHGVLTTVDVHGGITLAERMGDGMVYGFDCGHWGDAKDPRCRDLDWLSAECERMAAGILDAAEREDEYMKRWGEE